MKILLATFSAFDVTTSNQTTLIQCKTIHKFLLLFIIQGKITIPTPTLTKKWNQKIVCDLRSKLFTIGGGHKTLWRQVFLSCFLENASQSREETKSKAKEEGAKR